MHTALDLTCDEPDCNRSLTADEFRLAYMTGTTERRIYECSCEALTITIGRRLEQR